jgi:glycosyltransferase involved in cell wall biosynthesis
LATIHHGLAEGVYSFNKTPSDPYLAFLGRISPEKRPDRAISIAKRLGMRLKIAAKMDAVDVGYFRDEIKPLLADPLIEFIGEIGDSESPSQGRCYRYSGDRCRHCGKEGNVSHAIG